VGDDDIKGVRLVVTATVDGQSQVIALDYPKYRLPRTWTGQIDFAAITPAWIHRHFDVVERPGKTLELRPRPERVASPAAAFVADDEGTTVGLVCVRPTMAPLILEALRQDWNAKLDDQPYSPRTLPRYGVSCTRDKTITEKVLNWAGRVGTANFVLQVTDNDSVNLVFLGHAGRPPTNTLLSAPAEAMARATFDALIGYLNERLRDPEWRAHLIPN